MIATPQPATELTAESKALLERLGAEHVRFLTHAETAHTVDRADWLDIIGDGPTQMVLDALPAIEAAAASRATEGLRRLLNEAAILAHSFGGCTTDYAHCPTSTCVLYRTAAVPEKGAR